MIQNPKHPTNISVPKFHTLHWNPRPRPQLWLYPLHLFAISHNIKIHYRRNLKLWLKCHIPQNISQLITLQRNTFTSKNKKKKNPLNQKKLPRRNANAAELLPPRATSNAATSSIHFEFPAKPIRRSEKPAKPTPDQPRNRIQIFAVNNWTKSDPTSTDRLQKLGHSERERGTNRN